jgi:hypothetical protein
MGKPLQRERFCQVELPDYTLPKPACNKPMQLPNVLLNFHVLMPFTHRR